MEKYRGKILTIKSITALDCYHMEDDEVWNWSDEMLEPVETQEEAYIKNDIEQTKSLGETMKDLFDEALNVIKENPYLMQQLNKSFQKIQDENEDLKIENKNLQAKIDYLRGQISVYERYLDIKKEEN